MQGFMNIAIVALIVLAIVMPACAPRPEPTSLPAIKETAASPSTRPAWEDDWERTLSAARKEGTVTISSGYRPEWRQAFSEAMAQKYSVAMDFQTGRVEEVISRVIREQKINIYNADVVLLSTSWIEIFQREGILQPLEKALILPEVVDPKAWYRGQLTWLGPDERTMLAFREAVAAPIVINTDLVKSGELKSWNDLLDPKWKRRIVLNDPTISGGGQLNMTFLAYGIKDWDFIKALLKQEPEVQRDSRLSTEWVARGKFPIFVGPRKEEVFQFMQAGASIEYLIPSEGTYSSVGDGIIGLLKSSPHPNAAKVFVNFLLSKEGGTLSSKITGYQSLRIDVPTDHLETATVRQPGMKYISSTDKGYMEKQSDLINEVKKLFEAYMRK